VTAMAKRDTVSLETLWVLILSCLVFPFPSQSYFFQIIPTTMNTLRDGIMLLLQSSSTCWAIAVNDYGAIVSTCFALATFAALFFFAYVLHKTLASRTPENRLRQQQKHRRKKRKPHGHHARGAKGGGRLRSTTQLRKGEDALVEEDHTIDKSNDDELLRNEVTTQPALPPLAEDEPVVSPPVSLVPAGSVSYEKSLLAPSRVHAISTSTLDSSVASSVDDHSSCGTESGRSTPTPAVANEASHPAVVAALEKRALPAAAEASRAKAKIISSAGVAPNRVPSANSRRSQNSRRGKKAATSVDTNIPATSNTVQAPTVPSPSKRWDALKPPSRGGSGRGGQRHPGPGNPRHTRDDPARFDADASSRSATEGQSATEKRSTSASPKHTSILQQQQQQPLPIRHAASFPVPPRGYMQGVSLCSEASQTATATIGDELAGYGNAVDQLMPTLFASSPSRNSVAQTMEPATLFSSLNPNSPSWNDRSPRVGPASGLPIRPPPGLETFRNDIPFGCGSSDGGNSAPASPFPSLPSILDIYQPDNNSNSGLISAPAPCSPFHSDVSTGNAAASDMLFLRDYQGLSLPPDEGGVSLPFRSAPGRIVAPPPLVVSQHRHLRENPFAMSDEEADDDQIEAELQELGGQMVGSILDF
jgi:hypothetical protein